MPPPLPLHAFSSMIIAFMMVSRRFFTRQRCKQATLGVFSALPPPLSSPRYAPLSVLISSPRQRGLYAAVASLRYFD